MRKLLTISLILCITTSAFGQWQSGMKPMLGRKLNKAHQLGDFVGAWFMNEGSGTTVFDLSGNGNTGSLVADTHFVPGKFGPALEFDGTGDKVTVAGSPKLAFGTGNFTIYVVAKWLVKNQNGQALGNGDVGGQWRLGFNPSGGLPALYFRAFNDITTTAYAYGQQDVWYHIAVVRRGTAITMYNGGEVIATGTSDEDLTDTTLKFGEADGKWMNGQVSHAMLYNRALSASEIALLYIEPFCMFVQDDIALMEAAIAAPPPTGGQVIIISKAAIPLLLIIPVFIYIKRKKCQTKFLC